MEYLVGLVIGLAMGGFLVYMLNHLHKKAVQETFSALSLEALRKNSEDFLKLADQALCRQAQAGVGELEGKKKLIDQTLDSMKSDLQKVERLITEFDGKREKAFGEVSTQLKLTAEQTGKLQETTGKLQSALASTKARGQWGERMAEDVLRLAGFIEGVNYLKQKTQETTASRPDYTFFLPKDLKVNMDVKFPLDNYMKYLNEENESARDGFKQQFLRDARQRIKEVTTRDYISPRDRTVDYVLVFIPSEQVYCFINEADRSILDEAMKSKVVLCSPLTLYAVLAVVRQAVDSFNLSKTTSQILNLLGEFNKQWESFKKSMDRMGDRIEDARKEYQHLVSTRTNQMERPLARIEDLRKQQDIAEAPTPEANPALRSPETKEPGQ